MPNTDQPKPHPGWTRAERGDAWELTLHRFVQLRVVREMVGASAGQGRWQYVLPWAQSKFLYDTPDAAKLEGEKWFAATAAYALQTLAAR